MGGEQEEEESVLLLREPRIDLENLPCRSSE